LTGREWTLEPGEKTNRPLATLELREKTNRPPLLTLELRKKTNRPPSPHDTFALTSSR